MFGKWSSGLWDMVTPHETGSHWEVVQSQISVFLFPPQRVTVRRALLQEAVLVCKAVSPNWGLGWDLMSHPHVHEWQLFPGSIFQDFPPPQLAQSLGPGFKATVQRGPGDHGYYKKVKVRGQRKVRRVFSAWGFEHHLSCHLLSFLCLSGTYIQNCLKYFYALRFLKKYKMWEFNVSENKDCCLCSLSGSGS